jgi:hypothetical protein
MWLPLGTKYGPILPAYIVQVPTGYSAFIGRNNGGESCLLQLIFRELFRSGKYGEDKIVFIPADRSSGWNTTQRLAYLLFVISSESCSRDAELLSLD